MLLKIDRRTKTARLETLDFIYTYVKFVNVYFRNTLQLFKSRRVHQQDLYLVSDIYKMSLLPLWHAFYNLIF